MKKKWTFKRVLQTAWIAAGLTFMGWLFYSYQSHGVDGHWLEDSTSVSVQRTVDFFSFPPARPYEKVKLFYPGAIQAETLKHILEFID